MSTTWFSKIFNFNVERHEIPRAAGKAYLPMGKTQIGVLHTMEGFSVDGGLHTLQFGPKAPDPPHFCVGENRIVQCRPIGVQAAALVGRAPYFDNQYAAVQIEMAGFTGGSPDWQHHAMDSWLPVESTLRPLVALLAFCAITPEIAIPLQRPSPDWKDDCSDIKNIPATDHNTRRQSGVWPHAKGWYYHLEVAHNNHYDCGAMHCSQIFAQAQALIDGATTPTQPTQPTQPSIPMDTGGGGAPAPLTGVIKPGDMGAQVKQLQTILIALGYLAQGADDGNFGPHTLNAVRKFQSDHGLHVDGIVGPTTGAVLSQATQQAASGGN